MDLIEIGAKVGVIYVPFLFALCFHEFSHGLVAKWRGDNTAENMGRLTLNPAAHIDLIGTVLLPLMAIIFATPIFFGWARPVPVNSRNFKNIRTDLFWVALAGPLSNILLAIIGAILLVINFKFLQTSGFYEALRNILNIFILTNLSLAFFNLIPLHPLDGAKVLARFLPRKIEYMLEQNEHLSGWILLFLVLSGILSYLSYPIQYFHQLLVGLAAGGIL